MKTTKSREPKPDNPLNPGGNGVRRLDASRWYIAFVILQMNQAGRLPTLAGIEEKIKRLRKKELPGFYLGFNRSIESVIKNYAELGYLMLLKYEGMPDRLVVTSAGQKVLTEEGEFELLTQKI